MKTIYYKQCKNCNKDFETYYRPQKFCCLSCSSQHNNQFFKVFHHKICEWCKKEFVVSSKKKINRFCSRNCAALYNNSKRVGRSKKALPRTCKKCNEIYYKTDGHKSNKYCSNCYLTKEQVSELIIEQTKAMTLEEYMDKNKKTKRDSIYKRIYIRSLNRKWNADLQTIPCQVCGYTTHVELCHIKKIADFPPETTLGIINHPSNNLVLCPNHHWEFDNNCLQGTIKPRKDQVLCSSII